MNTLASICKRPCIYKTVAFLRLFIYIVRSSSIQHSNSFILFQQQNIWQNAIHFVNDIIEFCTPGL